MGILKVTHVIFALLAFITCAMATDLGDLNLREMSSGGKLFCVDPDPKNTYCLNILNYPKDRLEILFEGLKVDNSDA